MSVQTKEEERKHRMFAVSRILTVKKFLVTVIVIFNAINHYFHNSNNY